MLEKVELFSTHEMQAVKRFPENNFALHHPPHLAGNLASEVLFKVTAGEEKVKRIRRPGHGGRSECGRAGRPIREPLRN